MNNERISTVAVWVFTVKVTTWVIPRILKYKHSFFASACGEFLDLEEYSEKLAFNLVDKKYNKNVRPDSGMGSLEKNLQFYEETIFLK